MNFLKKLKNYLYLTKNLIRYKKKSKWEMTNINQPIINLLKISFPADISYENQSTVAHLHLVREMAICILLFVLNSYTILFGQEYPTNQQFKKFSVVPKG